MMDASLVVSIVAAGIAGGSAVFAFRSEREARRSNDIGVLEFLREYRESEASRRYVFRELANGNDPSLGISGLPDDAREHVVAVCHYLDHLGFLVDRGIVSGPSVAGLLGESVLRSWEELAPSIKAERQARAGDYAEYFEDLAAAVLDTDPRAVRKHLRSVPSDAVLPRAIVHRDDHR